MPGACRLAAGRTARLHGLHDGRGRVRGAPTRLTRSPDALRRRPLKARCRGPAFAHGRCGPRPPRGSRRPARNPGSTTRAPSTPSIRTARRAASVPVLTSNRPSPVATPVPSALTNASLRTQVRKKAMRRSSSAHASMAAVSTAEKNRRATDRQFMTRPAASTSMPTRAVLRANATHEPAWERLKSTSPAASDGRPCAPTVNSTSVSPQPSRRASTRRASQRPAAK